MNNTESLFSKCLNCNMGGETGAECLILFFLCAGLLLWIGLLLWLYRSSLDRLRAWFLKRVKDVTRYFWHCLWSLIFWIRPHARDVQEFARLIVHCRVRRKLYSLPLFGKNDGIDKDIEGIVDRFFCNQDLGKIQEISEDEGNQILNWLNEDCVSRCHRQMYLRVSYRIAEKTGKKGKADRLVSTYKSIYEKNIRPIERSEIKKICSEFREQFRKELDDFWNSRAKAPLFSFSLKEFAMYLPLISVLIIIGAYFHLSAFYGHFNIEMSQFFSLDDYVASSIEEIKYSLFFVGVYLVFWAAVLRGYRSLSISPPMSRPRKFLDCVCRKPENPTRKIQLEYARRERNFRNWVLGIAYSLCIAVLLCMIYKSKIIPLDGLSKSKWVLFIFILLICVWLVRRLGFWLVQTISWNKEHFKNVFAEIVLLSLVMFFSSMHLAAWGKIERIENSPTKVCEKEPEIEDRIYKGSLIGASNRYIFLRNPDKKTITIIPQSEAGQIVISTEKNCSSNGLRFPLRQIRWVQNLF